MLHRLRSDFHLTIITLFGGCAVFGILPFAIYRFISGNVIAGAVDAFLVLSISTAVVYAWRTGDTKRPGIFLSVVNTSGAMLVAAILGVPGLLWMYATLLANFFIVSRGLATILSAAALAILALHGKAFESRPQMVSFLATAALVSLFASIFAYRTETQRLQLELLATHDPLTGLHNRRAMEQELQIAIEVHKRDSMSFGLVMLDLDHFKRVNDQYGHNAGDRVLVAFADLIRQFTRKVDRIFRFGGEEFVLLLPSVEIAGLRAVTANLRRNIAAELRGPGGPVTISLGAAALNVNEDWHSWLKRADAALYRAKESGRDRAVVDGIEGVEAAAGM